jgi:nucleotide-binding universal stress UspA family protein
MRRRLLVPLDGSPASEAALALAELIPSRSVHLLRTEHPSTGGMLAAISPQELANWRAMREQEMGEYLETVAGPFRDQGRDVTITTTFAEPSAAIIEASEAADLIVMATHGRGGAERALVGSVADRVVRNAPIATLLVRGGDSPTSPPPIGRIVVPLDGSSLAELALPVATDLASDLGVPIHIVQVIDSDPVRDAVRGGLFAAQGLEETRARLERDVGDHLSARAMALLNQDERADWELRFGNPAAEINAALKPGDLLVMTTHARGGLSRWLLGSVANRLVREVQVPILLVRPGSAPAAVADAAPAAVLK